VTVTIEAAIFRAFAFNAGSWPEVLKLLVSILAALIITFVAVFVWNLFIRAPVAAVRQRDAQLSAMAAQLEAIDHEKQTARLRERIKTMLGEAHAAGEKVFKNNDETAAEEWVTSTHTLIKDAFGPGEAVLFLSNAGYTFFSSPGQVRNWVDGRLRRLISLIQRCDGIPIRENFILPE
jgi:hypothetical protein